MNHKIQIGDTVQIGEISLRDATPGDINNFLMSRGWLRDYFTSMGNADRWTHEQKGRHRLEWAQAMAIEFYEFITIGGR